MTRCFEMLAKMSRLTLPDQPFHVPVWRRASLHTFTLRLHHVMRVGHLESPMVWCSLLYPSPARPACRSHGVSLTFHGPCRTILPSYEMLQTATWLVRALLVTSAGQAAPTLAEGPLLEEALPFGSQSTAWLPLCHLRCLRSLWSGLLSIASDVARICTWVGGWGPRYLGCKRRRGSVRVPSFPVEGDWVPPCEAGSLEP